MNKIDPILNQDFSGAFNLYSGSDILSMGYSDSPKRLEHLRKKTTLFLWMLPNSIRNPPFSVATVPDPGKHGHLEIPHPFSGKTLKKYPFSHGKNMEKPSIFPGSPGSWRRRPCVPPSRPASLGTRGWAQPGPDPCRPRCPFFEKDVRWTKRVESVEWENHSRNSNLTTNYH